MCGGDEGDVEEEDVGEGVECRYETEGRARAESGCDDGVDEGLYGNACEAVYCHDEAYALERRV